MGMYEDITALPKEEQLDAALAALRDLLQPNMQLVDHLRSLFQLTMSEGAIMAHLFNRAGRVCSKESLLNAACEMALRSIDEEPEIKIVDVYVCKIRKKIGKDGIQTDWGRGYFMTPEFAQRIAPAFLEPKKGQVGGLRGVVACLEGAEGSKSRSAVA